MDTAVIRQVQAYLDAQTNRPMSVRQEIVGMRLRGDPKRTTPSNHPYVEHMQYVRTGKGPDYREEMLASWRNGQVAALSYRNRLSDQARNNLPQDAFYWSSNRGLNIEFYRGYSGISSKYQGLDHEFWPQELHGYLGVTPLGFVLRYAESSTKLEVLASSPTAATLRMPANKDFSEDAFAGLDTDEVPFLTLSFDLLPRVRLTRFAYSTEKLGTIVAFNVRRWQLDLSGQDYGTEFEYEVHLGAYPVDDPGEDRVLIFDVQHQHTDTPGLDGQTVCDLVAALGFINTGQRHMASSRGAEFVIREALDDFAKQTQSPEFAGGIAKELTQGVVDCLTAAHKRIRQDGAAWPRLTSEFVSTGIVAKLNPFDLEQKYCSQLAIGVLRGMHSQPIRFAQILKDYPGDLLSMGEVERALADAGLAYRAIRTTDPLNVVDDRPFTALLGDDPKHGHLALAQRVSDTHFRIWSPPNNFSEISAGKLKRLSPLGIFMIPADIAPRSIQWRTWLGWGCTLLGLTALVALLASRRTRQATAVASTGAALMFLFGSSCQPAAAEAQASNTTLIKVTESSHQYHVGAGQNQKETIELRNLSEQPIVIRAGATSCSCVQLLDPEREHRVAPGALFDLRLSLTGVELGMRDEEIQIKASAGPSVHRLKIPIRVLTGSPMYTQPKTPQLSGRPGEKITAAFDLIAICSPLQDIRKLTWECDLEGLLLEVEDQHKYSEGRTVSHSLTFACTPPKGSTGNHLVNIRFALPRIDGEPMDLMKMVSLAVGN